MRRLGSLLGIALLIVAAATGFAQILSYLVAGRYEPIGLATLWVGVDAGSLAGLQRAVENRLTPDLWPPVLWVLRLPAWLATGVAGALLWLACRSRHRAFT